MNQRSVLVHLFSIGVFAATASVGCNSILGNEEGKARPAGGGGQPLEAGVPPGDAGIQQQACDTSQGNKVCFGLCVRIDQTNTGCGGASCEACDPKNVTGAVCKGTGSTLGCAYDACKAGFENCDGQPANGCETSLNAKNSCGSCTTVCDGAAPFCALNSGVYGCVSSCPIGTQDCSGACVDTTISVDHCGSCNKRCSRPSASATCVDSECQFVCNQGTHECNGVCVPDEDPETCGPACISCPPGGDNTVRTCNGGSCGVACDQGFIDCDNDPRNGCEVKDAACPGPLECPQKCLVGDQCCNGVCVPGDQPCIGLPHGF